MKIDKNISKSLQNNNQILFFLIISLSALAIRIYLLNINNFDMNNFLLPWTNYLHENGGILGLRTLKSDYNFPYLYLLAFITYLPFKYIVSIKAISIIFDFAGAAGCYLLIGEILRKNNAEDTCIQQMSAFALVLLSPTVILNSSAWGQCDIIYTTFIIYSLYFFEKENDILSIIFLGISFAFKLQAILIFPVYIILHFCKKRFSLWHFFLIPLINLILCLPALLLGIPLKKILGVYFEQAGEFSRLVYNFPNLYTFVPSMKNLRIFGIIFTICILGILLIYLYLKKVNLNSYTIVELEILIVLTVTYFLPNMHDRYMFLADVISILYFCIKKKIYIPLAINFMSLNSYLIFLFNYEMINIKLASIIQLFILICVLTTFMNDIKIKSKL